MDDELHQIEMFDDVASAVSELEIAQAEFIRLHRLIQDAGSSGETFRAIDDAGDAYARWRDAAFRLRDLR